MTKPPDKPFQHLELIPATSDQEPVLANMLELYSHDFSEFHDIDTGEEGRFGYASLSLYWSDPDRYPFLIKLDGRLAGFVLVKRGSKFSGNQIVWDMVEFFDLRGYRRRGIGTQIAHEVWKRFPGPWEVRVMQSNISGSDFWAHAVATFSGGAIQSASADKHGKRWNVYSFQSKPTG